MTDDFNDLVDSVVLAAADQQDGPRVRAIPLNELLAQVSTDFPPTWAAMVEQRLRELQYGALMRDSISPALFHFEINAAGVAYASMVRERRRPRTVIEQLTSEASQRLVNLLNFSVALAAFIVALIALFK